MANQRLSLTRDQFASFLSDFEQIKQFEKLFSTVDTIDAFTLDEINISAATANATANEALSGIAVLNSLVAPLVTAPPPTGGTVTSVYASGGTTGLTFTGSPITTTGTLTLGGTLAVANGGTGQTSYTDGQLLIGNSTGNTLTKATLIAGSNITITNGAGSITIAATDAFVGTVTSVSVVSANGFAGTVATATTTPAITLSTSVNGIIKGNGTALSAAVAATDYVAPSAYASANGLTMATSRLLGRTTASTGAAEEISVAGGLTLSGGVLTGTSGTVTSVTGTAPVVSSGGATPAISMPAATTSVNGYLTSTDWTTFNNKGSGTVTSVAALTLGTTGTDLSSTVANGTTTPVITLQVPTASATNRGALSAADWTTFNNKGSGTVTSVSGTGTVNGITLTGTVTSSGSLTLGGTLSNVSLTTQVTGVLPTVNGGTGQNSYVIGDLLYASSTSALARLADVATGNALISGGVGAAPSWGKIGLTTHVSGTLGVGNGGTGTATTFTTGSVVFAGASGVYSQNNSLFFWDNTNARLGLGTAAPGARVHARQASSGATSVLAIFDNQVENAINTAAEIQFFVNDGGAARCAAIRSTQTTSGNYADLKFYTSNSGSPTERLALSAAGTVTALGVYNNTVGATNRAVFVDNTGLLGYVVSILASKTEINDLTDTSWLHNLRPVSFHYRKRDEEGTYTDEAETPLEYGLIAEEVEIVNPEMVFYDETPDGPELRSVSYNKLVIPMLKEIQALRARIEELERNAT